GASLSLLSHKTEKVFIRASSEVRRGEKNAGEEAGKGGGREEEGKEGEEKNRRVGL
ncbi:hypothetical protein OMAG_002632, partial [Candidatus Omnitrophus magneticus]